MNTLNQIGSRTTVSVVHPDELSLETCNGFTLKDINNGVLFAVMVDAGLSRRLHYEDAGP